MNRKIFSISMWPFEKINLNHTSPFGQKQKDCKKSDLWSKSQISRTRPVEWFSLWKCPKPVQRTGNCESMSAGALAPAACNNGRKRSIGHHTKAESTDRWAITTCWDYYCVCECVTKKEVSRGYSERVSFDRCVRSLRYYWVHNNRIKRIRFEGPVVE